jgi:hypothetical protein
VKRLHEGPIFPNAGRWGFFSSAQKKAETAAKPEIQTAMGLWPHGAPATHKWRRT